MLTSAIITLSSFNKHRSSSDNNEELTLLGVLCVWGKVQNAFYVLKYFSFKSQKTLNGV